VEIDVYHLEFYRECQPIKLMRVVPALEIDFYHGGKLIFTTVEKLFFTTLEINFYYRGN